MTTVAQLRKAILASATEALAAEPHDTEARLNAFIAKLSGAMNVLGEDELDTAVWALFETRQPDQPAPGALQAEDETPALH